MGQPVVKLRRNLETLEVAAERNDAVDAQSGIEHVWREAILMRPYRGAAGRHADGRSCEPTERQQQRLPQCPRPEPSDPRQGGIPGSTIGPAAHRELRAGRVIES